MSKSLAYSSEAPRGRLNTSHPPKADPHASLGIQGHRIHHLMDSLQGHQARQDPELQNKLMELERVLGGIDPLLSRVEKRLDSGQEVLRDSSSNGGQARRESSNSADTATHRRPSATKQMSRGRARLSTDGLHAVVDSDDQEDDADHGSGSGSDSDLGDVKKVRWAETCSLYLFLVILDTKKPLLPPLTQLNLKSDSRRAPLVNAICFGFGREVGLGFVSPVERRSPYFLFVVAVVFIMMWYFFKTKRYAAHRAKTVSPRRPLKHCAATTLPSGCVQGKR